jgi:UDP-2-acetamido-2-deoxy-ribo-hexuluronate aminotransferase
MEKKFCMKIDYANLSLQYQNYKKSIDDAIFKVVKSSKFIMGEEVHKLEQNFEIFTGVKHSITCSSGTDALLLAMMAMDIQPGDEIITTPFTWVSTSETIALLKARPVFVDIEPDTFNIDAKLIEAAITKNTRAIMPVSLFGQPADIDYIQTIANKYDLKVIIDGAQSFGSTYKNKTDSNLGDISITSFFPSKPLGCYGDGGAVFTNNDDYAEKIKMLRVHGQNKRNSHKYIGIGGRMDTIQAAILLAKLKYFPQELKDRKIVAEHYTSGLSDILQTPVIKSNRSSVWGQYTVRVNNRDDIQNELKKKGIPTSVFYPVSLHLQECFKYLNYKLNDFPISEKASNEVISIPMNPFLTYDQIDYIVLNIKKFLMKK